MPDVTLTEDEAAALLACCYFRPQMFLDEPSGKASRSALEKLIVATKNRPDLFGPQEGQ